ncbi:MAG: hypothetical protein OXI91_07655 [Chloroflexota bacterium]|nr:hypothetical protein [Chloroflexota bacterium]
MKIEALSPVATVVCLLLLVACLGPGDPAPPAKSDAPAYAEHLVREAIAMYDKLGSAQTLAHYSSPASVDGPWYVFIASKETERNVAHWDPAIVGRDLNVAMDSTGYCYGCAFLDETGDGSTVSYLRVNHETGEEQKKHSFIVLHDGYIFGAGWYEDIP